ncbi:queuosine precursor transporter [Thiotrichales bacterium 19X7-9]|nr:queuosine precursor transporter [Thiotrichales bacterium 19X7-9]
MFQIRVIKQIFSFANSYNKLTIKGYEPDKKEGFQIIFGVSGKRNIDKKIPLNKIQNYIEHFNSSDAFALGAMQARNTIDLDKQLDSLKLKTSTTKFFLLLSLIFLTILCVATVMATRLVNLPLFDYFTPMPGAIIIFPLSFFLMDVICEVYGYPYARRLIWTGILCQFIFSLLCYLCMQISSIDTSGQTDIAFERVIGVSFPLAIGSLLGISIGLFINCYIMEKLGQKFHGKLLWLRSNLATFVGEFFYTLIWTTVVFVISMGKLNTFDNFKMTLAIVFAKVAYEILLTPLVYYFVIFFRKYETHNKQQTSQYTPFTWSLK